MKAIAIAAALLASGLALSGCGTLSELGVTPGDTVLKEEPKASTDKPAKVVKKKVVKKATVKTPKESPEELAKRLAAEQAAAEVAAAEAAHSDTEPSDSYGNSTCEEGKAPQRVQASEFEVQVICVSHAYG